MNSCVNQIKYRGIEVLVKILDGGCPHHEQMKEIGEYLLERKSKTGRCKSLYVK